jgi:hypothetical protein
MSVSRGQIAEEFLRRHVYIISGDGSATEFTIIHNLDNEDVLIQARDIQDSLRGVFLDNYPDALDPLNKVVISFDFAPSALQSYRIIVIG